MKPLANFCVKVLHKKQCPSKYAYNQYITTMCDIKPGNEAAEKSLE